MLKWYVDFCVHNFTELCCSVHKNAFVFIALLKHLKLYVALRRANSC